MYALPSFQFFSLQPTLNWLSSRVCWHKHGIAYIGWTLVRIRIDVSEAMKVKCQAIKVKEKKGIQTTLFYLFFWSCKTEFWQCTSLDSFVFDGSWLNVWTWLWWKALHFGGIRKFVWGNYTQSVSGSLTATSLCMTVFKRQRCLAFVNLENCLLLRQTLIHPVQHCPVLAGWSF